MKILKTSRIVLKFQKPDGTFVQFKEGPGIMIGPVCQIENPSDVAQVKLLAAGMAKINVTMIDAEPDPTNCERCGEPIDDDFVGQFTVCEECGGRPVDSEEPNGTRLAPEEPDKKNPR